LDTAIDLAQYVRDEVNKIPGLYCFGKEVLGKAGSYGFDPTKITINCRGLGLTGYELEQILAEEYHIQFEMSDLYNILAVGSFGDTKEKHDALLGALREISAKYYGQRPEKREILELPAIPELAITPRQAYYSKKKRSVPLKESVGLVSAESIMAYPPGIAVVNPGEIITKEIIDYVQALKDANLIVQGTEDPEVENVKVIVME
jgi:arginine decarboxylase